MKTCYYRFVCDDDLGECYGFFELDTKKTLKIIHWFDANDASYHEYMNGLFKHFGIKMVRLPGQYDKKATTLIKEECGV